MLFSTSCSLESYKRMLDPEVRYHNTFISLTICVIAFLYVLYLIGNKGKNKNNF